MALSRRKDGEGERRRQAPGEERLVKPWPREQLHLRPAKALITTPSGSIRLCAGRSVLSRRESRISGRQRVRGAGLQALRPGRALWSPVSSHLGDPNWSPWDRPSVARTPPATTGPPVQWRSRVFDRLCLSPVLVPGLRLSSRRAFGMSPVPPCLSLIEAMSGS